MLMPKLTSEKKREMIREIQSFFEEERDEQIGDLAAEIYFDFIKDRLGPVFYNAGVEDAREIVEQRMQVLEEDLFALKRK